MVKNCSSNISLCLKYKKAHGGCEKYLVYNILSVQYPESNGVKDQYKKYPHFLTSELYYFYWSKFRNSLALFIFSVIIEEKYFFSITLIKFCEISRQKQSKFTN